MNECGNKPDEADGRGTWSLFEKPRQSKTDAQIHSDAKFSTPIQRISANFEIERFCQKHFKAYFSVLSQKLATFLRDNCSPKLKLVVVEILVIAMFFSKSLSKPNLTINKKLIEQT